MNVSKIATPLSRKAVLVSVSCSQWTARKLDKRITDETNRKYNAAQDAGRFNKLLIAKEHLQEIQGLVSQVRMLHYSMTQPWTDEGPRILPNVLYTKFSNEFRVLKRMFNDAADKFAAEYPAYVERRKRELNGLFNDSDYPSPKLIRSKFRLEHQILPFPNADDFRANLDEDTVADIRSEIESTTREVTTHAMRHTVGEIVKLVGHMSEKLREKDSVFRNSLVDNIRELADLLPAFNLTDDPKLTDITSRIKRELCTEDADTLRKNPYVRRDVQKSADEIVSAVGGLFA